MSRLLGIPLFMNTCAYRKSRVHSGAKSPWMDAPPMLGDVAAGADPHTVAGRHVVEKLDEPGDPAGAAGQPVVQCQRHQLGVIGALLVHDLEAVDHVAREILAGRETAIF